MLEIGGQEHFYLESQVAIAIPGEQGQMTIHSSTQHPSEVQMMVAEVLGVPFNHVVCICKRMGGGFGGKETQAAQPAMMAALLAAQTRRPVRFVYSKDDDMRYTGKRHPFKAFTRPRSTTTGESPRSTCSFSPTADARPTSRSRCSNGRCSTSTTRTYLPNVRVTGRVCRTNLPSNTAFRGFGGPQGVAVIENVIEEIAAELGIDALDVRQANCYGVDERNVTPYGQIVRNNTLPELFATLRARMRLRRPARRDRAVQRRIARRTCEGMALSAVKFGISFTRRTMNQANALVNVYQDGSVIVSTGATEMGQGVYTRVRQIVADELGVGYDAVIVAPTSTDKNNNTSPTAASAGTDLNGAAAADACRPTSRAAGGRRGGHARAARRRAGGRARARFASRTAACSTTAAPHRSFRSKTSAARRTSSASASASAASTPRPASTSTARPAAGSPFLYYTNGVACSEVLIDRFTGELAVTRVDLLMDVGKSINPGIDRGQVIGGFVQGMGWVTAEELVYGAEGRTAVAIRRRRTRFPTSPTCRRRSTFASSTTRTTT